jgi:cytidylate kinase
MSIVAISETVGSQGDAIGRELARTRGWEFADREIIARAAERYGEGVMELQHITQERPSLWERFTDSKRHYLSYVEATILELAARDDVVLVGHGAAVLLRPIPHTLRVRVTAPAPVRAERVKQQQGLVDDAALDFVRETDHERAARIKFLYRVDLDDPLLYDLALNTERLSVAEAATLIAQALQAGRCGPTERSRATARDLSLAAQARARLVQDPATRHLRVSVTAADGALTATGTVDSEPARTRVLEIAGRVSGAERVVDKITVIQFGRGFART